MNIKQYQEAIPVIEELELLNSLKMPNVKQNNNTKLLDVIDGKYTNSKATGIGFCFTRNDYGDYNPELYNNDNRLLLHEHEYNELKNAINKIVENRINIQKRNLEKI